MFPGRCSGGEVSQMRHGELVLVKTECAAPHSSSLFFVCTVDNTNATTPNFAFSRQVVVEMEDTPPPPLFTPIALPIMETPITKPPTSKPSTPFSFKEFASALKDTTSGGSPSSLTSTPVKAQPRSSLSSLTTAKKPRDLKTMKQIQVSSSSPGICIYLPNSSASLPPAASSVSLEFCSKAVLALTPATRRRIHSWFVGMLLTETCVVRGVLNSKGLDCVVRRIVPSSSTTYCRVVQDTRLVFEFSPPTITTAASEEGDRETRIRNVDIGLYKGVVLRGPRGTGKRFAVARWMRAMQQHHHHLQCSMHQTTEYADLLESAHKFLAQQHAAAKLTITLLDGESPNAFATPSLNRKLAHLMDDDNAQCGQNRLTILLLINESVESSISLPALLTRPGRLEHEVVFALPDAMEREQFARDELKLSPVAVKFARDECVGYSHADILHLFSLTNNSLDSLAALQRAAREGGFGARNATRLDQSTGARQEVGGQLEAKKALAMAVEWPFTRKEELRRFGLDVLFRGILLFGPAGCAKTTMVREIARRNAGNASFYALSGADVYSSGFGDAEAKVRSVFAQARATAPSILFFDEIDSLVGNRGFGGSGDSVQSRVLSTFLNEMDGVDTSLGDTVVVIGATNCPQNLDRALLRPGRFDRVIFVGPPDPESVLKIELERMHLGDDDMDLAALAREAEYMSGADIAGACRLAAVQALSAGKEMPSEADIIAALRVATRSCKPELIRHFMEWNAGEN